jgi:hypothetical protein
MKIEPGQELCIEGIDELNEKEILTRYEPITENAVLRVMLLFDTIVLPLGKSLSCEGTKRIDADALYRWEKISLTGDFKLIAKSGELITHMGALFRRMISSAHCTLELNSNHLLIILGAECKGENIVSDFNEVLLNHIPVNFAVSANHEAGKYHSSYGNINFKMNNYSFVSCFSTGRLTIKITEPEHYHFKDVMSFQKRMQLLPELKILKGKEFSIQIDNLLEMWHEYSPPAHRDGSQVLYVVTIQVPPFAAQTKRPESEGN